MEKDDLSKNFVEYLNCPCEIISVGEETDYWRWYQEHQIKGKQEGYLPIIIQAEDNLWEKIEYSLEAESVEIQKKEEYRSIILKKAEEIQAEKWFRETIGFEYEVEIETGAGSLWEQIVHKLDSSKGFHYMKEQLKAPIIAGKGISSFASLYDYTGNNKNEVLLARLPVCKPWEVAAYLPMGGWNSCPDTVNQTAVFKYWYEKFGAIAAVVTSDTLEFYVENPPSNETEARELALEQYIWCPDRVDQWSEDYTLGKLAGDLLNSKVWYFWWD